jgi:hypothetical protein
MARAPVPGACKTRLACALGAAYAAELYRAMLLDTLAAYSKLRFSERVLLAAPENDGVAILRALAPPEWSVQAQVGPDLGTRLTQARAALGDGPLILASSDSPTAPYPAIGSAVAEWNDRNQVLLGPCTDGGYYLIGLAIRELGVFRDIPWSTNRVALATRARCAELGLSVRELPYTYDIDEPPSLELLRGELGPDPSRAPRTAAALNRI